MVTLNFLPWREIKRERDRQMVIVAMFLMLTFILGLFIFSHGYCVYQKEQQILRNQFLQQAVVRLEPSVRKHQLLFAKRKVLLAEAAKVNQLQQQKTVLLHLFDELTRIIPLDLYLTQLDQKVERVTMSGVVSSQTVLADFMHVIEKNHWIRHPTLVEVNTRDNVHEFKLHCELALMEVLRGAS
jgi:type IV pilus assembly protein PilN